MINPVIGSTLIGAGSSLLSGILGYNTSRSSEDRAFQRSLQLQKMQNDFNVQMWNKNNQYNSPSHQLELLKEAGINPALYDVNGGFTASSEVTSSDASVPVNNQPASAIAEAGRGMSNAAASMMQNLSVDAQIAKLRSEIKYQDLLNRDLDNQIRSKERLMSNVYETPPYQDENGNWVSENYPRTTAYDEQRQQGRQDIAEKDLRNRFTQNELEVYQASMPYLKQMSKQQLRSLLQDIRSKALSNELTSEDVKLMKQYGISPNDDGLKALFRIALRDPDSFNKIIDGLGDSILRTFQQAYNRYKGYGNSHRNPSSW